MKHKHQTEPILCQLDLQDKINDRPRGLHLLLDPPVLPESQLTIFDTEKQKDIKRNYRNIWILQDPAYAAARGVLILQKWKVFIELCNFVRDLRLFGSS